MKKVFGIILILAGLITLPQVFSHTSGIAEAFGGLMGVSLVSFLPAYFLIRNKREENEN